MFIKAKLDDGKELIINIDDVQAMGGLEIIEEYFQNLCYIFYLKMVMKSI